MKHLLAGLMTLLLSTVVYAAPPAGGPPAGPPTPPGNGNDTEVFVFTDTEVTHDTYMGMSNKAPANAHAAASQGTRTEQTTTTTVYDVTVEGPHGQIKDYEPSPDLDVPEVDDSLAADGCNNCIVRDVEEVSSSSDTEITDLPGANR